ncbi:hypothetical protein FJ444_08745 [Aestuariibacter sp. GS-14]|uniref:hypothetical protein n=1 Tax=Alteromonadaceae TaxID=72275 RepID=UPI001129591A|nr:hypothetical protein [Aestuariibacter sp. GS-14]TPV59126.1 hypothetical protein FJ444_08745 [Aestuariibacter sp. GS-14]
MKKYRFALASCLLSFAALSNAIAQESNAVIFNYAHQGKAYPPVFFVTNVEDKSFKEKLVQYNAFAALDDKAVGLPIGVRVLKGHRTKQDGTQFSSLMLSASTLGIIPVVSNKEFKVRYDVFVQGKSIESFEYMMDSTDVNNFWTSAYKEHQTTPTEEQFLLDTLPQFLNELSKSDISQATFAEYWEYFSE